MFSVVIPVLQDLVKEQTNSMTNDSTGPSDSERESASEKREEKRNFRWALIQGTFMRMSFSLIDASTILPAFVYTLTRSKILVGLAGSLQAAGWMWPQLLMSNIIEHRPRKMKFYTIGMSIRLTMWLAICLCTIFIGVQKPAILATCFFVLYFIAASSMGISTVPYMDIISKAFNPKLRTQYFILRQLYGGLFAVLLGFFIRAVLGNSSEFTGLFGGVTRFFKLLVDFFVFSVLGLKSDLTFPHTYALLFGCALIGLSFSFASFLRIHEPIRPVQTVRKPIWEHLKRGPYFLRIDANYRCLLLLRICSQTAGMSTPFFVPYAMQELEISEGTIGSFLVFIALSGVISNVWWGYVGKKHGLRRVLIVAGALTALPSTFAIVARMLPSAWQLPCYFLVFVAEAISISGMWIGFMSYLLNIAPPLHRPTYLGFMNTILFPTSFAPLLGGVLVHLMGYEGLFMFSIGIGILAFLTATRLQGIDD